MSDRDSFIGPGSTPGLGGIRGAQTRVSMPVGDTPEELEALADRIEKSVVPIGDLALSLLCAALCRRVAKLERAANG